MVIFFSPPVHKFLPKPSSNKDLSRWRIVALRFLPPLRLSVVLLRLLWVLRRVLRPVLSGLLQRVQGRNQHSQVPWGDGCHDVS